MIDLLLILSIKYEMWANMANESVWVRKTPRTRSAGYAWQIVELTPFVDQCENTNRCGQILNNCGGKEISIMV